MGPKQKEAKQTVDVEKLKADFFEKIAAGDLQFASALFTQLGANGIGAAALANLSLEKEKNAAVKALPFILQNCQRADVAQVAQTAKNAEFIGSLEEGEFQEYKNAMVLLSKGFDMLKRTATDSILTEMKYLENRRNLYSSTPGNYVPVPKKSMAQAILLKPEKPSYASLPNVSLSSEMFAAPQIEVTQFAINLFQPNSSGLSQSQIQQMGQDNLDKFTGLAFAGMDESLKPGGGNAAARISKGSQMLAIFSSLEQSGALGNADFVALFALSDNATLEQIQQKKEAFYSALQQGKILDAVNMLANGDISSTLLSALNAYQRSQLASTDVQFNYRLTGRVFLTASGKITGTLEKWEIRNGEFERAMRPATRLSELGIGVGTNFLIWDSQAVIAAKVMSANDLVKDGKTELFCRIEGLYDAKLFDESLGRISASADVKKLELKIRDYSAEYTSPLMGGPAIALQTKYAIRGVDGLKVNSGSIGIVSKEVPYINSIGAFVSRYWAGNTRGLGISMEAELTKKIKLYADYSKLEPVQIGGFSSKPASHARVGLEFSL